MSVARTLARAGALASGLLLAGCATAPPPPPAATADPVHWSYAGEHAPERWGTLSPAFAACETGTMQSPVDLANAQRAELPDLRFDYASTPLTVEHTGHTVQVDYTAGGVLTVGGAPYTLVQFHFHTPAEHRVQGRELPAELHLVHRNAAGELAVVGVLIERGAHNAAFAPLLDHLPARAGQERQAPGMRIDAEDLLPADRALHYRYPGSLTTPPCTEGVTWLVLAQPVQLSAQQIDALQSTMGTTNRPVQPLGTRALRLGT